jgi:hypothetical protein
LDERIHTACSHGWLLLLGGNPQFASQEPNRTGFSKLAQI